MDPARHQLLAGTAFTCNQDGRPITAGARHLLVYGLHHGTHADDIFEAVFALKLGAQAVHLLFQLLLLDGALDEEIQFIVIERFLNVVGGAALHRLDRGFHGAVARHDDEFNVRILAFHGAEELDAVHFRHLEIRKNEIDIAILGQHGQRFARRRDGPGVIALALEHAGTHRAMIGIIFYNENSCRISQHGPLPLPASEPGTSFLVQLLYQSRSYPNGSRRSCNRSRVPARCLCRLPLL